MTTPRPSKTRTLVASLGIGVIALGLGGAFLWTSGVGRATTTETFLAATPKDFPAGYRRAHGKGICFSGVFRTSGQGADLSSSRLFAQAEIPAIGRFSLGAGDPSSRDTSTRTLGMALMLTADDGQQWRMKMNSIPYFIAHSPEAFLERGKAFEPVPATGQPDPQKVAAFLARYPEAQKFLTWSETAPWPGSFAGTEYNAVHTYIFVNDQGQKQPARWVMRPRDAFQALSPAQREAAAPDQLLNDLKQRVTQGPIQWDMVMQLAEDGDAINDPSQPWPSQRNRLVVGTLDITSVTDQTKGQCRDVNFDPTLVPKGIRLSDDPVLAARAGIYAHSYNARLKEVGYGKAAEAVGKAADQ